MTDHALRMERPARYRCMCGRVGMTTIEADEHMREGFPGPPAPSRIQRQAESAEATAERYKEALERIQTTYSNVHDVLNEGYGAHGKRLQAIAREALQTVREWEAVGEWEDEQ